MCRLGCLRASEEKGSSEGACYSSILRVSASVPQVCPACSAVEAERFHPWDSALVLGEGGCEQDRACGCRDRVGICFLYFCGISGSHARGGSRQEQTLVLRGENSGCRSAGKAKQGFLCAVAVGPLRPCYSHQHTSLLDMPAATL